MGERIREFLERHAWDIEEALLTLLLWLVAIALAALAVFAFTIAHGAAMRLLG